LTFQVFRAIIKLILTKQKYARKFRKPIIAEVNLNGEQNSQNLHIHELAPTEAYEIPIDRETKKIESISYGGDTEIEGIKVVLS